MCGGVGQVVGSLAHISLCVSNGPGYTALIWIYFPAIHLQNLSPPAYSPHPNSAHTFSNPINPSASHFFISLQRDRRCP